MKLPDQDPQDMAYAYLEGLVWVMKYYYHGCASWDWFYPFVTDLLLYTCVELLILSFQVPLRTFRV